MKYWTTSHWPCFDANEEHSGVWVQDEKKPVIEQMKVGDQIFIYETRTGPAEIDEHGSQIHRGTGQQGIVALVVASSPKPKDEGGEPTKYADGRRLWWRWYMPTRTKLTGYVPRGKVAQILGYSRNWTFRGFGKDQSGLLQIEKKVFQRLLASFRQTKPKGVNA